MSAADLLREIGERVQLSGSVRNVYGEPIVTGDRTVVPVARVAYSFGAGSGPDPKNSNSSSRGAGGGRATAKPVGALEITPEGTRFVPLGDQRRTIGIFLLGLAMGTILVALASGQPKIVD